MGLSFCSMGTGVYLLMHTMEATWKHPENTGIEYKLYETIETDRDSQSTTLRGRVRGPHQPQIRSDRGGASAPPVTASRLA